MYLKNEMKKDKIIPDPLKMDKLTQMKVKRKSILHITKTYPYNVYPLISHFYIAKMGYAGIYLFFLFLLVNIDCGYVLEWSVITSNEYPQSMFSSKNKKNIQIFLMKIFIFNFLNFENLCILHECVSIMK